MPIKFAFLGAWHSHAVMHVREAAERPDEIQLLGMYDSDPAVISKNQERWKELFSDIQVSPSAEAVLESDAEIVITEGHVYQNLDYAEMALEAGKHVLLEKPAGVDLEQYRRIQDLSVRKGLRLHMAYMWRYSPAVHEILRLARLGVLGDIFYFRGHIPKRKSWHPELDSEFSVYEGGIYFEMAGHLVDIMVTLMGEPTEVHPVLRKHYGNRREVDNAVVVHEFESGLGTIDMAGMEIGMARRIEVHGTGGTAINIGIGSPNLDLSLETASEDYKEGWQELKLERSPEFPSLLREIAACIRGEKEPDYSLGHDITVQQVLYAGCGIQGNSALKEK